MRGFQLPLSGSHPFLDLLRNLGRPNLSTPSLGITGSLAVPGIPEANVQILESFNSLSRDHIATV